MASGDEDADLMLRVKRGDLAAFESLVNKYKQAAINLAARTLGDPDEAEDVAQAAFVQAYKAADRYTPTAKFTTWFFTIVRNLCLNEIRRRNRHPADRLESVRDEQGDEPPRQVEDRKSFGPAEETLQGELESKVKEALYQLPENQRMAILFCSDQELSYEEISDILGCSLSATKSLIFRGRERLKMILKEYLKTGNWTVK